MTKRVGPKRWIALSVIGGLIAVLMPVTAVPAVAATSLSVTLSINHFKRFEVPDDGIGEEGEFFPEIRIGNGTLQRRDPISDDSFNPSDPGFGAEKWVFTDTVSIPDDKTVIPVLIRVYDDDGDFNGGVDRMDISPANQDIELNLEYDLLSESWSGDGVPAHSPCDNDPSEGQTCAKGDGDPNFPDSGDGKVAEVGFSLSTSPLPDIDADGIPDMVERFGVRDRDGSMVADLAALGADPCRKSVVLQIDYMNGAADGHSHKPKDDAITEVKNAFDASDLDATTPCPYPGTHKPKGVDFVYVPGKPITEQTVMNVGDSDYQAARTAGLPDRLRPYAHYAIFAHDIKAKSSTSGRCCSADKDFIATLGHWRIVCVASGGNRLVDTTRVGDDVPGPGTEITPGTNGIFDSMRAGDDVQSATEIKRGTDKILDTVRAGDDVELDMTIDVGPDRKCDTTANAVAPADDLQVIDVGKGADDAEVGTVRDQAGTIMHELGHALGLAHGGDKKTNYKPNYLSVMNYLFDPGGIPTGPPPAKLSDLSKGPRRLDYSAKALDRLDKSLLDESKGINDGTDITLWTDPKGFYRFGPGTGPLNWNNSTDATTGAPTIDAGMVPVDINADDDAPPPRETVLGGFEDWHFLKFDGGASGGGVSAGHDEPDIDFATVLKQEIAFFGFYDPDIATTKTVDKASAEGGDTLGYTVRMNNVGSGPATAISVADTMPDGAVVTRSRAYLDRDASASETFSYLVPCATEDGAVLTNKATVTAKDAGGDPEVNTADNTATAATTVHAPKLTLTKTVPPTGNAGEAVTTGLVVRNTGSATATGVTVTDKLPAEVYYSQALDLGAGPKPSTVARNADGTTTLTWSLGSIDGGATLRVQFTARPSLLYVAGNQVSDAASAAYRNANGCVFAPATATGTTRITEVAPSRDPRSHGYWKTHSEAVTSELLARVQATDQRFDGATGAAPDGALSGAEAANVLSAGGSQPGPLKFQLLATLLDMAARQINASTKIDSSLTRRLGVTTVGGAVRYAFATLALPLNSSTADRYSDTTTLLDQIVNNQSEVY